MVPPTPSESQSSSASEDTTSADLGGFFQRGGKITPRTESGYSEWIAIQSAEQILSAVTSRRHSADGGQGLGLWRSPLDPLWPDSNA